MLAGRVGVLDRDVLDAMTLRELTWATEGAERSEHMRLTRLEAFIGSMLGKRPIRPGRMDPYHKRVQPSAPGKNPNAPKKKARMHIRVGGQQVSKQAFDALIDKVGHRRGRR